MNSEIPNLPDTQMDEFEASSKTQSKLAKKNNLKIIKLGALAIAVMFVVGIAVYALTMLAQTRNTQVVATPAPTAIAVATPSPTPEVQYPDEYKTVEKKIDDYQKEVTGPQEGRVRLNPPQMNIGPTF